MDVDVDFGWDEYIYGLTFDYVREFVVWMVVNVEMEGVELGEVW